MGRGASRGHLCGSSAPAVRIQYGTNFVYSHNQQIYTKTAPYFLLHVNAFAFSTFYRAMLAQSAVMRQ